MENAPSNNEASSGTSALDDGLGTELDGMAMLENVRDQLAATGQAGVAGIVEKAIALIDAGLGRIGDMHRSAQIVTSAEADFDAMTWTFQIGAGCRTGGGRYALIKLPNVAIEGLPGGSPARMEGSTP